MKLKHLISMALLLTSNLTSANISLCEENLHVFYRSKREVIRTKARIKLSKVQNVVQAQEKMLPAREENMNSWRDHFTRACNLRESDMLFQLFEQNLKEVLISESIIEFSFDTVSILEEEATLLDKEIELRRIIRLVLKNNFNYENTSNLDKNVDSSSRNSKAKDYSNSNQSKYSASKTVQK